MTKRLNLLLLPAAFLFTTGAIFFPQDDQPAEAVYKNIQSFKGTPARDILPAMKFISSALKVNCGYCHVKGDFAADTKEEKQSARKMIAMQAQLNKEFFEGKLEITCNSCHNGHTHPTSVPTLEGLISRHKRIETTLKPEDLFQKYVAAAGPEPKAITLTGTSKDHDKPSPVELTISGSKFLITEGEVKIGFDGQTTWHSVSGKGSAVSGDNALGLRRMARLRVSPATFATYERQMVAGKETVGSDSCLVVRGTSAADHVTEEFYFDENTGLLRRIATTTMSPLGRVPSYVDFSDYRDVAGSKVPFKVTSVNGEGEVSEMNFDSGKEAMVDDKMFMMPQ